MLASWPVYRQVDDAARSHVLPDGLLQALRRGEISAGKEARIKFPHTFTVYHRSALWLGCLRKKSPHTL